jgi:hypothetical protein
MNWRILLPISVTIAVVLAGLGAWQAQATKTTYPNAHQVPCTQNTWYCQNAGPQVVSGAPVEVETASGRRNSVILWSAAAGVLLVTLASIPLLRERERRQAATG